MPIIRIVAGATSSMPRIHAAISVCTAARGRVTSTPYIAARANADERVDAEPAQSTSGSTGVISASGPTRLRGAFARRSTLGRVIARRARAHDRVRDEHHRLDREEHEGVALERRAIDAEDVR